MTTEIEKTCRNMYEMLEAMRKAKKHPTMLRAFEEALEEHLEALRQRNEIQRQIIEESGGTNDLTYRLGKMTEERDQIQGRLHAIDHAYCEQSNLVSKQAREIDGLNNTIRISGEELIRVQGIARQHLDDCRRAEGRTDELHEQLTHATSVIGQQEQLIVGQRMAIAELFGLKNRKSQAQAVKCAHEFHPAFPGGERCVYCLEQKSENPAQTQTVIRLGHKCECTGPEFRFRKVSTISGTFEHCEKCFGHPAC